MRDLNDDSSSNSWPHFYGDKSGSFVQYSNGHLQRNLTNVDPEHERDALKQTMLEHEAVFKIQVCELHRLYQIQRNMMDEVKRKDFNAEIVNSPLSLRNISTSKEDISTLNRRPSKLRKIFDLQLPADDYIDFEDEPENVTKMLLVDHLGGSSSKSASFLRGSGEFVDLNEPVRIKGFEPSVRILDFSSENNTETKNFIHQAKSKNLQNRGQGFSRSVVDSRTHFYPNQVRVPTVVHPVSYGREEDRWREGTRNRFGTGSGSYNGFLACESSNKPFLTSTPYFVKPSGNNCVRINSFGVMNQVSEPVIQSQDVLFRKMYGNSSSKLNPSLQSESNSNGFYNGSASASGFKKVPWLSKAIDLNEEVQRSHSDEVVILDDLNQAKNTMSANDSKIGSENEMKTLDKIMGFTVFHENEPSSIASTSASCLKKGIMIDINVAYNEDEVIAEEQHIRDYIDLNASIDCYEDTIARFDERSTKRMLEIDLEAPFVPEYEEDNETEQTDLPDQRKVAELVLEISNQPMPTNSEFPLTESLLFFADSVTAFENGSGSEVTKEIDDFEAMTLQIEETTEEYYMPKATKLQVHFTEENGNSIGRPRRGQVRRGRPRRDFQRDIIPGITSLSRHELTEDLQIFGCLMRAMGHCWSPGSTRRNGSRNSSGRGRKRGFVETVSTPLIQKLNKIEGGSEDRSLTGWGKTTRRPRRQRGQQGD